MSYKRSLNSLLCSLFVPSSSTLLGVATSVFIPLIPGIITKRSPCYQNFQEVEHLLAIMVEVGDMCLIPTISSRGWTKTIEYRWKEERWRSLEQRPLRCIATRRDAKFGSSIKESKICLCGWRSRNISSAIGGKLESKQRVGLRWCLSGKESACQCRRCGFDPWVGKIHWRREWQPTSVFF